MRFEFLRVGGNTALPYVKVTSNTAIETSKKEIGAKLDLHLSGERENTKSFNVRDLWQASKGFTPLSLNGLSPFPIFNIK
jgi:hypothetical protein